MENESDEPDGSNDQRESQSARQQSNSARVFADGREFRDGASLFVWLVDERYSWPVVHDWQLVDLGIGSM